MQKQTQGAGHCTSAGTPDQILEDIAAAFHPAKQGQS